MSAEEYFHQHGGDRTTNGYDGPSLNIQILVITASRSSPAGYLVRVLAELTRQTEVLVTSGYNESI